MIQAIIAGKSIPPNMLGPAIRTIFDVGLKFRGNVSELWNFLLEKIPSYTDIFSPLDVEQFPVFAPDCYKDEWFYTMEAHETDAEDSDVEEIAEVVEAPNTDSSPVDPHPITSISWRRASGNGAWRAKFLKKHKFSVLTSSSSVKKPFSEVEHGLNLALLRWLKLINTGVYPLRYIINADEVAVNESYNIIRRICMTGTKPESITIPGERNRMTFLPIISMAGTCGIGLVIMHGTDNATLRVFDFTNVEIPFTGISAKHAPREDKPITILRKSEKVSSEESSLDATSTAGGRTHAPPSSGQETLDNAIFHPSQPAVSASVARSPMDSLQPALPPANTTPLPVYSCSSSSSSSATAVEYASSAEPPSISPDLLTQHQTSGPRSKTRTTGKSRKRGNHTVMPFQTEPTAQREAEPTDPVSTTAFDLVRQTRSKRPKLEEAAHGIITTTVHNAKWAFTQQHFENHQHYGKDEISREDELDDDEYELRSHSTTETAPPKSTKSEAKVKKGGAPAMPKSGKKANEKNNPNICSNGCAQSVEAMSILKEDHSHLTIPQLHELIEIERARFVEKFGKELSTLIRENKEKRATINEFVLAKNSNAWMTGELMSLVPEQTIKPMLNLNEAAKLPGLQDGERALLLLDNCSVHHDYDFLEQCLANRIDVTYLYPNTTSHGQPADVGYNRPLKNYYKTLCYSHHLHENVTENGQKPEIFRYLQHLAKIRAAACMVTRNSITKAFLYPIFKSNIPPEARRQHKCPIYEKIRDGEYLANE